jgi:hypothetical protein
MDILNFPRSQGQGPHASPRAAAVPRGPTPAGPRRQPSGQAGLTAVVSAPALGAQRPPPHAWYQYGPGKTNPAPAWVGRPLGDRRHPGREPDGSGGAQGHHHRGTTDHRNPVTLAHVRLSPLSGSGSLPGLTVGQSLPDGRASAFSPRGISTLVGCPSRCSAVRS